MPSIGPCWPVTTSTSPPAVSPSVTCLENDDMCILEREQISFSKGINHQDTFDIEIVDPKDLYLDRINPTDETFESIDFPKDAEVLNVSKDRDKCAVQKNDAADLAKSTTINSNWTVLDQQAPPNISKGNNTSCKKLIPVKHFPKPQNGVSSESKARQPFLSAETGTTTTLTALPYEKNRRKNHMAATEHVPETRSEHLGRAMDQTLLPPASIFTPTMLDQAAVGHDKALLEARILAEDDGLFARYVKRAKKGTIEAFMAALPYRHQDRKQPINILWVKGAGALARRMVFADTRSSMSEEGERLLVGAWKRVGIENCSRDEDEDEDEEGEELRVMEEYVKFVREATRGTVGEEKDVEGGTQDAPFRDFMRRTWILFRSEDSTGGEEYTARKYYLLDFKAGGCSQGYTAKNTEKKNNEVDAEEKALTGGQNLTKQADEFRRVLERTSAVMRAGDAMAHERREHLRKLAQVRRCSKPEDVHH